jgi:hypothetical protein
VIDTLRLSRYYTNPDNGQCVPSTAHVELLRRMVAAVDRSGLVTMANCRVCDREVFGIPDGLALCEPCAINEIEAVS